MATTEDAAATASLFGCGIARYGSAGLCPRGRRWLAVTDCSGQALREVGGHSVGRALTARWRWDAAVAAA